MQAEGGEGPGAKIPGAPPARGHRPVLLVEYDAHSPHGHGPYDVAWVAEELARIGHDVHVLTLQGWRLDEGSGIPGAASMATVGPAFARLHRWARRLAHRHRRNPTAEPGALRRMLSFGLESVASTIPIHRRARALRRAGVARDDLAVVVLCASVPFWATLAFAPRHGRWVVTRQRPPADERLDPARASLRRIARARSRRRRGTLRVAASTPGATRAWSATAPWLDVRTVPTGTLVPGIDASQEQGTDSSLRAELGIAVGTVALALGAVRPDRDFDTLFEAFAGDASDPDLHLLVGGLDVGERLEEWRRTRGSPASATRIAVRDGFVPDEDLPGLFTGADCLVLPYGPAMQGSSGLLHLAVVHHVPVVCSDACAPADLVRRFGLGPVYRHGDPASLRDAVSRAATWAIDDAGRAAYIEEFSVDQFARRLVALADDEPALG